MANLRGDVMRGVENTRRRPTQLGARAPLYVKCKGLGHYFSLDRRSSRRLKIGRVIDDLIRSAARAGGVTAPEILNTLRVAQRTRIMFKEVSFVYFQ